MNTALTIEDYKSAAAQLGCEVAAVQAVTEVESGGNGYDAHGNIKLLFEAHLMGYFTGHKFDLKYPHLSCMQWEQAKPFYNLYYLKPDGSTYSAFDAAWHFHGPYAPEDRLMTQMERFKLACTLDDEAACKSSSWGYFQICGFNAIAHCGYPSARAYVNDMLTGAPAQLNVFVKFCLHTGLNKFLVSKDWVKFAEGYNGALEAQQNYHGKIAVAYAKYAAMQAV